MPSIKFVERQIGNLEGFDVQFLHLNGRDVRSDRLKIPSYQFERAAKGSMTVSEWVQGRFLSAYPGFECEVLDSDGQPCHGNTQLSSVRDSYYD